MGALRWWATNAPYSLIDQGRSGGPNQGSCGPARHRRLPEDLRRTDGRSRNGRFPHDCPTGAEKTPSLDELVDVVITDVTGGDKTVVR